MPEDLERVALPSSLRRLSFGRDFNRSLSSTVLPEHLQVGLKSLLESLGALFQVLAFGKNFNQSLREVRLPRLHSLTFGKSFNQSRSE